MSSFAKGKVTAVFLFDTCLPGRLQRPIRGGSTGGGGAEGGGDKGQTRKKGGRGGEDN